jgi:hypothetical protein
MTRFCPNCGKPVDDSQKFCTFCSKKLAFSDIPIKPIEAEKNTTSKKTTMERIFGILVGILLLPATVISAIFLNPLIINAPISIAMMIYGIFVKKHKLALEIIFFGWALAINFGSFANSVASALIITLQYTPVILDAKLRLVLYSLPILVVIGGFFFFLTHIKNYIQEKFKVNRFLLIFIETALIIILLVIPFFMLPQPKVGEAKGYIMGGTKVSSLFTVSPDTTKAAKLSYDATEKVWKAEITLENKTDKTAVINKIYLNKELINTNSGMLVLENISFQNSYILKPMSKGKVTIISHKTPIYRVLFEESTGYIGGFDFLSDQL